MATLPLDETSETTLYWLLAAPNPSTAPPAEPKGPSTYNSAAFSALSLNLALFVLRMRRLTRRMRLRRPYHNLMPQSQRVPHGAVHSASVVLVLKLELYFYGIKDRVEVSVKNLGRRASENIVTRIPRRKVFFATPPFSRTKTPTLLRTRTRAGAVSGQQTRSRCIRAPSFVLMHALEHSSTAMKWALLMPYICYPQQLLPLSSSHPLSRSLATILSQAGLNCSPASASPAAQLVS